jgi:hypothetical protein
VPNSPSQLSATFLRDPKGRLNVRAPPDHPDPTEEAARKEPAGLVAAVIERLVLLQADPDALLELAYHRHAVQQQNPDVRFRRSLPSIHFCVNQATIPAATRLPENAPTKTCQMDIPSPR